MRMQVDVFFKIPGRLVEASGVLRLLNSEF
jgi:hypothetical protein